jgi:cytochrome c oxidase accessory protein FixG
MTTASGRIDDAGPAGVTGPAPRSWRARRWVAFAAQGAVLLGLPFLRVRGESALRLDVPSGRLHAFGAALAVDEAFVVLAATLLVAALFLLATVALGRAWCGWGCPQTVLGDLTLLVEPSPGARRRPGRRAAGFALVALVAAVAGADLVWYFESPYDFLPALARGTLSGAPLWGWVGCAAILFLDLAFLRQSFCATACPYAKLQGVLFDRHTLVVAYDAGRDADCIDCLACVRVCPTRIDIRDGLQMECIACAACVDACAPIMRRLGRRPDLVGYFHGEPGARARWLRPATIALAGATLLTAALLAGTLAARPLVAVTLSADAAFSPRRAPGGRVVNAFELLLESHAREPVDVALSLELDAPGAAATLRPEALRLGPGERRRVRGVASATGLPARGKVEGRLLAVVRTLGLERERRSVSLKYVQPEEP